LSAPGYPRMMATRSIVTSQPDIECDVCARRLLRGESPETFLAAGQRRIVCELCAPRATHEGWLRETGSPSVSLPPLRPRRGRNLFDRLRQVGKSNGASTEASARSRPAEREPQEYEFLDGSSGAVDEPLGQTEPDELRTREPSTSGAERSDRAQAPDSAVAVAGPSLATVRSGGRVERAIALFNAGEHPRRVAGVARSLGAPGVSVRPDKDFGSLVSIVIAWELCWYRYGVDIDDEDAGARVLAQGTELTELDREERLSNAVADEFGVLSLSAA
jgi:hypothetical protein